MTEIQNIVTAIESRAWYPLAALLVTIALRLLRQVSPEQWSRLPQRWQWAPAVLVSLLAAFVDAAASGATWQVALGMVAYSALAALTAIGAHHTVKRLTP